MRGRIMTEDALFWQLIEEAAEYELPELTDEQEEKLRELDRRDAREKNLQRRLADCGKWSYYFSPHTGMKKSFRFRCGKFRKCDNCRKERANREKDFVIGASYKENMVAVRATQDTATKFLRDVNKTEYVRYPQEKYDLVLINQSQLDIVEGEKIDIKWLLKQNWEKIVNTPKGRNKSGTVHLPTSIKDEGEFAIINVKQIVSNAPRNIVEEIMDEVVEETKYLDPNDKQSLIDALNLRIKKSAGKLRGLDYVVSIYIKKQKIVIDNISWINSVTTKNPTRNKIDYVIGAEKVPDLIQV